jgi:hypothetical protein
LLNDSSAKSKAPVSKAAANSSSGGGLTKSASTPSMRMRPSSSGAVRS